MSCIRFFFATIAIALSLQIVSAESVSRQQLDVMVGNSDEFAETSVTLNAPQNPAGFGYDDHAKITSVLATVKETIATARELMENEETHKAGTEMMEAANTAFREVTGHIAERKLHDQQTQEDEGRGMNVARQILETVVTFPECLNMFLTDCLAIINSQISSIGLATVEIVVHEKRNLNQEGYNKVVIVTNEMADKVVGRAKDRIVSYPFMWDDKFVGSRLLSPWNCVNITPEDCCLMIKQSVPNKDTKDNYIECHIYVPFGGIGKPKRNDRVFVTVSQDGRVHEPPIIQ